MLALIFAVALQAPDAQQRLHEEEAAARISNLHMAGAPQVRPFATIAAMGAWGEPNEILSLFAYRSVSTGTVHVVRKNDLNAGDEVVATSASCPDLVGAITQLESVPLPQLDVPLAGAHETDRIPPTVKDGVGYQLWAPAPLGHEGTRDSSITVRFRSGSEFEAWYQRLHQVASSCWR